VQLAMQAARAVHDGRDARPLLRYVRVQMTFVSSLHSEASEFAAALFPVTAEVLVVRLAFSPQDLH
jgi:hypothetical protein